MVSIVTFFVLMDLPMDVIQSVWICPFCILRDSQVEMLADISVPEDCF